MSCRFIQSWKLYNRVIYFWIKGKGIVDETRKMKSRFVVKFLFLSSSDNITQHKNWNAASLNQMGDTMWLLSVDNSRVS